MSYKNVRLEELEKAVASVGARFSTMDIARQEPLRRAHGDLASHSHWNAFVGGALSLRRPDLGIAKESEDGKPNARWIKVGAGPMPGPARDASGRATGVARSDPPAGAIAASHQSASGPVDAQSASASMDLGPQYGNDAPFTARMRLHQSYWRATVLMVPCGVGPTMGSTSRYGNMLDPASGAAGRNFLTPEIFAVAQRRIAEGGGTVEPYRLLHNLLSSQPMCFNLFGPLVEQPERAARLLRSLVGDEVARIHQVRIEWAPQPASDYLADRTSLDAFIDYERPGGARVALGIETKLTDSFSQTPYDGPSYRRWMDGPRSPFRPAAAAEVAAARHNQLWRNHLLCVALRDRPGGSWQHARSAVVHHPLDAEATSVVESYMRLLRPEDDTFAAWSLETVVAAFERASEGEHERGWLRAFRDRYLALDRSEALGRAGSR